MAQDRRSNPGRDRGQDDPRGRLHGQIVEMLLDKVREDPYPSTTHLDLLESILEDDEVAPYAEALLDKVRDEAFPSIDHLNRLLKLA